MKHKAKKWKKWHDLKRPAVKEAYRKAFLFHHPDKGGNASDFHAAFKAKESVLWILDNKKGPDPVGRDETFAHKQLRCVTEERSDQTLDERRDAFRPVDF